MSIKVHQISFRYDQRHPVLSGCSFEVGKGEIVALIGKSGSGKSTLLRVIAGLETPQEGEIDIMDQVIFSKHEDVRPHLRHVGMVFQDYALFPHLTVEKNIAYGIRHLDKEDRESVIDDMLELVGLQEKRCVYPHELSGGQQQRIALARALARKPWILLLDEPFSNLDSSLRIQIRDDLLKILEKQGISCLFATHDIEDAKAFAHRIIHLSEGRIVSVEKCR